MRLIRLFISIAMLMTALKIRGQTNLYKTVLETNWVKPGPYLRVAGGVTYSVAFSQKWMQFKAWESLGASVPEPDNPWDSSHLVLGNYQIVGTNTFITILREHWHHDTYSPFPVKGDTEVDHIVALLNCEHPNRPDFYCMRTKDVLDVHGIAFRAYDCGVQATNLVPVVKKTKVKITN